MNYFPYILETHLADHCNLKCKGCSHFAPLADGEVFTDIEAFSRDMERFHELFDTVHEIRLMGGEPLLHPDLLSFFEITRKIFPKAGIAVFTNGIRLMDMPDIFWKTCAQKQILVKLTRYPIDLKIDEIKRKAEEKHVRIKIPSQIKSFFKYLNIAGDSNPAASFRNCQVMYKTPQLRDGKLYPCSFPAYVHYFSAYFNQSIYPSENDCISILKDVGPEEILKFLNQPIPMCRWCLSRRNFEKWGLSQKDIREWIGQEAKIMPHVFRKLKYGAIHIYHECKRKLDK